MAMSIGAEGIANALGGARRSGAGIWSARCPCHDDKQASLSIGDRAEGGVWVKCHAGCNSTNVRAELDRRGLWPASGKRAPASREAANKERRRLDEIVEVLSVVPPEAPPPRWDKLGQPIPTHLYEYRGAGGELLSYVARWDELTGKKIRPVSFVRRRDGSLGWAMKAPSPPWSLFGQEELAKRPEAPTLLVEGEKAALKARKIFPRYVVLSWRGGANAIGDADLTPLKDREVVLWPDADEPGQRAMTIAAERLCIVGASAVRQVIVPQNLPKGWDLADPPTEGLNLSALIEGAAAVSATSESTATAEEGGSEHRELVGFIIPADALMAMDLPKRENIIEPFFPAASLIMIYAERGLGKTWFALSLAIAITKGESFLGYTVHRPWRVLYIDGEMSLGDLQFRIRQLEPAPSTNLLILPSELLFQQGRPLNIHDPDDQDTIDRALAALAERDMMPDVIVVDNLSSLSGGVDENDNSQLDKMLRWLLSLRHRGVAVILIHHAGKSGKQRGASRREDLLDTSIALELPDDEDSTPHPGAHFVMKFVKNRHPKPKPDVLELRLTDNRGQLYWQFNEPQKIDRATEILLSIWEHNPETQKELGERVGLTKGAISQHCSTLRKAGYLAEGPALVLTPFGRERLIEVWPDLEPRILKQGDLLAREVI